MDITQLVLLSVSWLQQKQKNDNLSINWNNIRAIEGQREGFEELVCQLAGQEKITGQNSFVRVGTPDGGKECFWELKIR